MCKVYKHHTPGKTLFQHVLQRRSNSLISKEVLCINRKNDHQSKKEAKAMDKHFIEKELQMALTNKRLCSTQDMRNAMLNYLAC